MADEWLDEIYEETHRLLTRYSEARLRFVEMVDVWDSIYLASFRE